MTVVLEGIFTNISSTPCDKTHSCLILTYATNAWLLDDNNISMILFNHCYYLLLKPIQDNTLIDMFYHGILGIFWMSKYFFENLWGNYIFIFTIFQNSKFQTFSLSIIDWLNHNFIRNKQIKSFLKYLSCIYIENQSTKMFLLRYQLQVCTYN